MRYNPTTLKKNLPWLLVIFSFLFVEIEMFSQKALSFEAPGDYAEIPHSSSLALSEFTIEFWLKVEELGDPNVAGGEQTILDKRGAGESGFNFRLAGSSFPLPIFAIVLPGNVYSGDIVSRDLWHHIAVTQDTDTLKIYYNGILKGVSANNYNWNSDVPLRIGEFRGYPGLYLGLRGDIDDLRIWDHSRSQSEIQNNIHEILTGSESGLVGYWDFETIVGTSFSDLTSNGNNGIIYGSTAHVDSDAPIGFIPPEVPTGLRAFGTESSIELAWKPGGTEITEYYIYRGDSLNFLVDGTSLIATTSSPVSTYVDLDIVPLQDYFYRLRSSDGEHLSQWTGAAQCHTLATSGEYNTGVYYYPWYGPSIGLHGWSGEYVRDFLIPRQPPFLGHYSSRDPIVIRQHIDWMEASGIDFLVSSWWGQNSQEETTLNDYILKEIEETNIQFTVYYESAKLGLEAGQIVIDNTNKAELISDFNYIADTYFDHPNFLHIDGKPVIFLYLSSTYAGDYEAAFSTIRSDLLAKGYELFLIGDEVGWWEPSVSHMQFLDAISPYIMLPEKSRHGDYTLNGSFFADASVQVGIWENKALPQGKLVIPCVNPGFNNRPGSNGFAVPRQTLPGEDGTPMFEEYIKVMRSFVEPEQKMIMITSWNEWHEDSEIEPTILTDPTNIDVSSGGNYYTLGHDYEGFGVKYLEIVRKLLASDLPPVINPTLKSKVIVSSEKLNLQITPNPIESVATLSYCLQNSGIVRIGVYDLLGNELHILVNEYQSDKSQSISFNTSTLADGIYFCRLQIDGQFSETIKMVVRH